MRDGAEELIPRCDEVLMAVLSWAESRSYLDHSKHDALNSPLMWKLFGFSKWSRIFATQAIMRFPVDLRSLLGVPQVDNPKGLALFLQAQIDTLRLNPSSDAQERIQLIVARLLKLRAGGGWGYHYPWQDLGFFAPAGTPNAVVTSFVCQSLMDLFELTADEGLLALVAESLQFLLDRFPVLHSTSQELCIGYMPVPMTMRVMDVSILVGAAASRHAKLSGVDGKVEQARRLVNYVVGRQTDEGAWYYCDPPGDSPLKIDNYHTGFILDALWQYMDTSGDRSHEARYFLGLRFYADRLFLQSGAPCWTSDRTMPHDVHGSAQGIITFSRHFAEFPGLADRIARWALDNLYSGRGYFYYQKRRGYTSRQSFMRWCNAWMARALSTYLRHKAKATSKT